MTRAGHALGQTFRRFRERFIEKKVIATRRWFTIVGSRLDARSSAIPNRFLHQIQEAIMNRYHFDGTPLLKNPFDLALYMQLISEVRPRTIIEIGSAMGGSGKWFASQLRGLGIDGRVHSYDVSPVTGIEQRELEFKYGDIYRLHESDLGSVLEKCERPLLVVEDGPHTYAGCISALRFFEPYLQEGDYFVVEDGNLGELGYLELENGPRRAIKEFLSTTDNMEIDYKYCDFYGRNATWNHDGYLRVVAPPK